MHKTVSKAFIVRGIFLAWLGAVIPAGPACAQAALPNGLALVRFEIRVSPAAVVGGTVSVEMVLKNLSGAPMQFDRDVGIFVGARVNSTSDANNRDFGHAHKGLTLAPEREIALRASRTLDAAGTWRFWPGFRLNGNWGPFRWMEQTLQVYADAAEAQTRPPSSANAGPLTVARLLANPGMYDGMKITVVGDAIIVRKQKDSAGAPWTLVSLADLENGRTVMNVVGTGHAGLSNGDVAVATGIFRMKSPRGRYTYDNELICDNGGILREEQQTARKQADQQADNRPIIDLRKAVGRQLDLRLLSGRTASVGTDVTVQFRTRTYAQSPRRNTIVATGRGTAIIRAEKAERRDQVTGPGSSAPGAGNTWLVAHAWLRGNAANAGMPDSFAQSYYSYDPAPLLFLVGHDGTAYWPDSAWSSAVTYQTRTDRTPGDIRMDNGTPVRSGLAFKVPRTIRDPLLVIVTYAGDNRLEYAAIRLE